MRTTSARLLVQSEPSNLSAGSTSAIRSNPNIKSAMLHQIADRPNQTAETATRMAVAVSAASAIHTDAGKPEAAGDASAGERSGRARPANRAEGPRPVTATQTATQMNPSPPTTRNAVLQPK